MGLGVPHIPTCSPSGWLDLGVVTGSTCSHFKKLVSAKHDSLADLFVVALTPAFRNISRALGEGSLLAIDVGEVELRGSIKQIRDSVLDLAQTLVHHDKQIVDLAGLELLGQINVHGLELVKEGGWVKRASDVVRDSSHVLKLGADNDSLKHALSLIVGRILLHLHHATCVDIAQDLGSILSIGLNVGLGEVEAVLDGAEAGLLGGTKGVGKALEDSGEHSNCFSFRFEI